MALRLPLGLRSWGISRAGMVPPHPPPDQCEDPVIQSSEFALEFQPTPFSVCLGTCQIMGCLLLMDIKFNGYPMMAMVDSGMQLSTDSQRVAHDTKLESGVLPPNLSGCAGHINPTPLGNPGGEVDYLFVVTESGGPSPLGNGLWWQGRFCGRHGWAQCLDLAPKVQCPQWGSWLRRMSSPHPLSGWHSGHPLDAR